jgi:steroid 5-alpha reductase family enzyme
MPAILLDVACAIWLYMTIVFVIALIKKDNSIVDIFWGLGFVLIAILTMQRGVPGLRGLIYLLVCLWGLRLAVHIFIRNQGRGEDFRYARWRKNWGKWFIPRSYLQIFMLQGLMMLIIAYPIVVVAAAPIEPVGIVALFGILIWIIGFYFEALGDYQLMRFKKNSENKGKIIRSGLWRYTRHPNYFGEVVMWWGVFLLALPVQYGWTTIISPIVITFLLLKISGVPMLEKKYEGSVQFEIYKQQTNQFFPWFPKKPGSQPKHTEKL